MKRLTYEDFKNPELHKKPRFEYFPDDREQGTETERKFVKSARENGWNVHEVTENENKICHYDFKIEKNSTTLNVEVKGRSMHPSSHQINYGGETVTVELVNVIGKKGWLYGKADLIAFEDNECFIIVNRDELVQVVEDALLDKYMNFPFPYYKYKRDRRVITMLHVDDIYDITTALWYKEPDKKLAVIS